MQNKKQSNFGVVFSAMIIGAGIAFFYNGGNLNLKSSLIDSSNVAVFEEKISEEIKNVDRIIYEFYGENILKIDSDYTFEISKNNGINVLEFNIGENLDSGKTIFSSDKKVEIIDKYAVDSENKIVKIK